MSKRKSKYSDLRRHTVLRREEAQFVSSFNLSEPHGDPSSPSLEEKDDSLSQLGTDNEVTAPVTAREDFIQGTFILPDLEMEVEIKSETECEPQLPKMASFSAPPAENARSEHFLQTPQTQPDSEIEVAIKLEPDSESQLPETDTLTTPRVEDEMRKNLVHAPQADHSLLASQMDEIKSETDCEPHSPEAPTLTGPRADETQLDLVPAPQPDSVPGSEIEGERSLTPNDSTLRKEHPGTQRVSPGADDERSATRRDAMDTDGQDNTLPEDVDQEDSEESEESDWTSDSDSDLDFPEATSGDVSDSESVTPEGLHEPLYPGARLNVLESMLLLLTFKSELALSWRTLGLLLHLIELHLPRKTRFVRSTTILKKFFARGASPCYKSTFCTRCKKPSSENHDNCSVAKEETVLSFNVEKQLEELFSFESFNESRNNSSERKSDKTITDIYDSGVYPQPPVESQVLTNTVTLTYLTACIYRCASRSIWVLYFVINELPYALRFQPQFLLLGAIWYGSTKYSNPSVPYFNNFLSNLRVQLGKLYKGILLTLKPVQATLEYYHGTSVQGEVINGISKLKIGQDILCLEHGSCPKCDVKSEMQKDVTKKERLYPYDQSAKLREVEESKKCAQNAEEQKEIIQGFKGVSVFTYITRDLIKSVGIDLRCVVTGVCSKLFELFFSREFQNEPFSLYKKMNGIDLRISLTKSPNFIKHAPRSIKLYDTFTPAEIYDWFFYFSVPLLDGILPRKYLKQYFKLVNSCAILNSESVTTEDLENSEKCLTEFVIFFQEEFGAKHMTFPIHSLLHLSQSVRDSGPFWTKSCLTIEKINKKVITMVAGDITQEGAISESFHIIRTISRLTDKLSDEPKKFLKSISDTNVLKDIYVINKTSYFLGRHREIRNTLPGLTFSVRDKKFSTNKLWRYHKLKKGNFLYVAKSFPVQKNISYCVYTDEGDICMIETFFLVWSCACDVGCACEVACLAVLDKYEVVSHDVLGDTVGHYCEIKSAGYKIVREVDAIERMVCLVTFGEQMFACVPANGMEIEVIH